MELDVAAIVVECSSEVDRCVSEGVDVDMVETGKPGLVKVSFDLIAEVCSALLETTRLSPKRRSFLETVERSELLLKTKFLDGCLVKKSKFGASTREKAWSRFHQDFLKHRMDVNKLTHCPATSAWICLKIFEHLVQVNYQCHKEKLCTSEQITDISSEDQDIVEYIGGSVVQKTKQSIFRNTQSQLRAEQLDCLQFMIDVSETDNTGASGSGGVMTVVRETDNTEASVFVGEKANSGDVSLTGTLNRGGLVFLRKCSQQFFLLLEVKVRQLFAKCDQENCTFRQFEKLCCEDDALTSKFAEIVVNAEAGQPQKEALFGRIVMLYFSIRVNHACRSFMERHRDKSNLSRKVKGLRTTLKKNVSEYPGI